MLFSAPLPKTAASSLTTSFQNALCRVSNGYIYPFLKENYGICIYNFAAVI